MGEEVGDALVFRAQSPEKGSVCLGAFVEHARVNGGSQEVVGGSDCMDVAGHVKVHVLHWHHLRTHTASVTRENGGRADSEEL